MRSSEPFFDISPPGSPKGSIVVLLRSRRDGRATQYYARRLTPKSSRRNSRNPYAVKALGTLDLDHAKRLAWDWWISSGHDAALRRPTTPSTFAEVAAAYLADFKSKTSAQSSSGQFSIKKYARHEQSLRLHLIPFWGDIRIEEIKPSDVERWLEWRTNLEALRNRPTKRKKYNPKAPTRSTTQKDAVAYKAVLKYARLRHRIDTTFTPLLPLANKSSDNRRPRFYPEEWALIKATLRARLRGSAADSKRRGIEIRGGALSKESAWYRFMLDSFVNLLHGTGLRVSEALRLRVRNLRFVDEGQAAKELVRQHARLVLDKHHPDLTPEERQQEEDRMVSERCEVRVDLSPEGLKYFGHERTVIPLRSSTETILIHLTRLCMRFPHPITGHIRAMTDLPDDLWLFCHRDGTRIKSFEHGFATVLKELGLLYRDGKRRSLTSIRHTYASERIEAGATTLRGLKPLADNMGTSVEMLQRHYAQEIRETMAEELQRT